MAHIQNRPTKKGKDCWRVQIRRKGFPEMNKNFATQVEAEAWAASVESGIENSKSESTFVIPKLPLRVWIERYKTDVLPLKNDGLREMRYLEFWSEKLGNQIATEITPQSLESCSQAIFEKVNRHKRTNSPETCRKYIMYLGSIYNYAIRHWKWATYNPISGVNHHREVKSLNKKHDVSEHYPKFIEEWRVKFCEQANKKITQLKLSQRQASTKSGMTLSTFQFVIDPKCNPTIKNTLKVCNALGIELTIS